MHSYRIVKPAAAAAVGLCRFVCLLLLLILLYCTESSSHSGWLRCVPVRVDACKLVRSLQADLSEPGYYNRFIRLTESISNSDGARSAAGNHVEAGAEWDQCEDEPEDSLGPRRMYTVVAPVGDCAVREQARMD
jgi:hypothetical protein